MDKPRENGRTATLDVGFVIHETFYCGPDNDFSQEQWQRLREPLYQPIAERYDDFLLAADLKGSAAELIRYYQDVVRLATHHRKEIEQSSQYFWMRPLIFFHGDDAITFPWYDTWEEAFPLMDALISPDEGLVFHDLEQGWEVHVFADRKQLFLRQGNFDSREEHIVAAVDRTILAGQVPTVRQRVGHLLDELTAALGRDYWSQCW